MRKIILTSILILVILILFFSGCTDVDTTSDSEVWGNAPDFTLKPLGEETIRLSDFMGKVVLLDFFGVDCGHCVQQTIALEQLRLEYSSDDLVIISIDVWGDNAQVVSALIQAYRCGSPCELEEIFSYLYIREYKALSGMEDGLELDWIFGIDSTGNIAYEYVSNLQVPKVVIVDQNGNIYKENIFSGLAERSVLSEKIDELI